MLDKNKLRMALVGLAVGDAFGGPMQFSAHKPEGYGVKNMEFTEHFSLPAGRWSDDTSMALCLAESLLEDSFGAENQLERYTNWLLYGHNSAKRNAFDVGRATKVSLEWFLSARTHPENRPDYELEGGNGSIMRLAPIPMFFHAKPDKARHAAIVQSQATHGHPDASHCCAMWTAGILEAAKTTATKDSVWLAMKSVPISGISDVLWAVIDKENWKRCEADAIYPGGYVVKSMEVALWAWWRTTSFEAALLLAANQGGDSDSIGAVCGQLAAVFYGPGCIPARWLKPLYRRDDIIALSIRLVGGS